MNFKKQIIGILFSHMSFDKLPFADTNLMHMKQRQSAKICLVLLRIIIGIYLVIRLMEKNSIKIIINNK